VRGYGHVKERSVAEAAALRQQRLAAFRNPQPESRKQPARVAA